VVNARDQMALSQLSGAAQRLTIGVDKETPRQWAVAALHAISSDPAVLGAALGDVLYRIETESPGYEVTAELLRAAGADEAEAAARLEWQRSRGFRL